METNRRDNRRRHHDDFRDHGSNHYRRVDEDIYRGAYRLDNESDHSDETTYDGFDLNDSMARHHEPDNRRDEQRREYRGEQNQGGDYVYRRSQHTEDNNRRYYDNERRSDDRGYKSHQDDHPSGYYRDRYGDGRSNFNNSYAPDPYRNQHEDQNYGNMSGSLSFGYDGDYNSDPEYKRRYDPISGKLRNNREEDNRRRHPDRYGPPDRFGINPDYDRY